MHPIAAVSESLLMLCREAAVSRHRDVPRAMLLVTIAPLVAFVLAALGGTDAYCNDPTIDCYFPSDDTRGDLDGQHHGNHRDCPAGACDNIEFCDGTGGISHTYRSGSDPTCRARCTGAGNEVVCQPAQVLTAMAAGEKEILVQAHGCEALTGLIGFRPTNQDAVVTAGGIDLVTAAMARFADDETAVETMDGATTLGAVVQWSCCQTLETLATDSAANKAAIGEAGGRGLASAAMARHPDHERVQWTCQSVLDQIPDIYKCAGVDCGAHGDCVPSLGLCSCYQLYLGDHCETYDTACEGVDCGAHSTPCRRGACPCHTNYTGDRCQTYDPCHFTICGEHGTCSRGACVCDEGWSGTQCQVPLSTTPGTCGAVWDCGAHGHCVRSAAACADDPHWTGTAESSFNPGHTSHYRCEDNFNRDYCDNPPAYITLGNGLAGDHCPVVCGLTDGCCACDEGWHGPHCEFSTDPCSADAEHPVGDCGAHGSCGLTGPNSEDEPDWRSPLCVAGTRAPIPNIRGTLTRGECTGVSHSHSLECTDFAGPLAVRCGWSPFLGQPFDYCPVSCGRRGNCVCEEGWYGVHCEFNDAVIPCAPVRDCGPHGLCVGNATTCGQEDETNPGVTYSLNDGGYLEAPGRFSLQTHTLRCADVLPGGRIGPDLCDTPIPTVVHRNNHDYTHNGETPADHCPDSCGKAEGCCACEHGWYGPHCEHNRTAGDCADIKEWAGVNCDDVLCPGVCDDGECNNQTKTCVCPTGRVGAHCGQWQADAFTRDSGTSLCLAGTDMDLTTSAGAIFESLEELRASCTACPSASQCNGTHNCSGHTFGNLCASCVHGYYFRATSTSVVCAKCPDAIDPQWIQLLCVAAVAVVAIVLWKMSKQEPYTPPSAKDVAQEVKEASSVVNDAWQVSQQKLHPHSATGSAAKTAATNSSLAATTMLRSVSTLVASIVWPHFTFSMLPLTLPHMSWPRIVTDTVQMFRSLAFLDLASFASSLTVPECINSTAEPAKQVLLRMGVSHGAFWGVLGAFALVRCASKLSGKRKQFSQRAVNAGVVTFFMAHAILLKTSLEAVHCTGLGNNGVENLSVGHIQSRPDVACDVRATTICVLLVVTYGIMQKVIRSRAYIDRQVREELGETGLGRFYPSSEYRRRFDALSSELDSGCIDSNTGRQHVICMTCGCVGASTCSICQFLCLVPVLFVCVMSVVFNPDDTVSASAYWLSIAGTCGILVYGVMMPMHLVQMLEYNINLRDRLDDPDFRARYGYLISRFKPGKWTSELRILSRKTIMLLVVALFSELPTVALLAQIVTLTWATWRQCREHPFAEVGSKKHSFERHNPTGWSRGDILEILSLLSQLGLNTLAFLHLDVPPDFHARNGTIYNTSIVDTAVLSNASTKLTISSELAALAVFLFTAIPVLYGARMVITEYLAGRKIKRRGEVSANLGEELFDSERVVNPTNPIPP